MNGLGTTPINPQGEFFMRTLLAAASLLLLANIAQAQTAARPAKPQVTLGADIKQLLFDWEPAAGATYYQMYVRYPGGSRFLPQGERCRHPKRSSRCRRRAPGELGRHVLRSWRLQQRRLHELLAHAAPERDAGHHWLPQGVQPRG
jgi:hypothetical protein